MQLTITSRSNDLTPSIKDHIRERLTAALDQHATRVRRVAVTLEDLNGPRGGVDQLCTVAVELTNGKTLHLRRKGADLYANISLVADKVKRRVGRKVARLRRRR